MSFKCPDCGASLTDDSRFCKYCGAKIDDGVKRSEIKIDINKRIEDVAEIKRAEREERESLRRERKEKAQTIGKWIRRGFLIALLLTGLIMLLIRNSDVKFLGGTLLVGVVTYTLISWLHKMMG